MNSPSFDLGPLYPAHLATMRERLGAALAAVELDGLVIFSGRARTPPRDDVPLPFRAEPHFLSWLPLPKLEGAALVLRPGADLELVFPGDADFWHAPPVEPSGDWVEHFAIHCADSAAATARIVARLVGGKARRYAAIGDPAVVPDLGTADADALTAVLDYARAIKTGFEAECIAQANVIAIRGHRAVARAFADDASEFDLHQTYLTATRLREQEFPYQNIVALNEHAAILHYQHLDTVRPSRTRSLLIDAGAQVSGYAADVTRTWSKDADEFRDLMESMDLLQQAICREVAPGVDFVELNERTHRELADVLSEHGIVDCPADEAYEKRVTRLFLPHGLGHFLGLQVHDVGGRQASPRGDLRPPPDEHPFLRLTRRLEPGMALTIEPGLYFIPVLLDAASAEQRSVLADAKIERLSAFGGIRIEDNLIVGPTSSRNVTREAFAAVPSNREALEPGS